MECPIRRRLLILGLLVLGLSAIAGTVIVTQQSGDSVHAGPGGPGPGPGGGCPAGVAIDGGGGCPDGGLICPASTGGGGGCPPDDGVICPAGVTLKGECPSGRDGGGCPPLRTGGQFAVPGPNADPPLGVVKPDGLGGGCPDGGVICVAGDSGGPPGPVCHDAALSGIHDAALSATHDAVASALHDPTGSALHDPGLSLVHDAVVSSTHDPVLSVMHDPALSLIHDAVLSAAGPVCGGDLVVLGEVDGGGRLPSCDIHGGLLSDLHLPDASLEHDPALSLVHDPALTGSGHSPLLSGGHDPAITAIHAPFSTALHDPVLTAVHDPTSTAGHDPVASDLHGAVISGAHLPEFSLVHEPLLSATHDPDLSLVHDPALTAAGPLCAAGVPACHDPVVSPLLGLHDPALTALHDPALSALHDPGISTLHDPGVSVLHDPVPSSVHFPLVSGGHAPVDSAIHNPVASAIGGDPPVVDLCALFGFCLGPAAASFADTLPAGLHSAQLGGCDAAQLADAEYSVTTLDDATSLELGYGIGGQLATLDACVQVLLPADFTFTDGWQAPPQGAVFDLDESLEGLELAAIGSVLPASLEDWSLDFFLPVDSGEVLALVTGGQFLFWQFGPANAADVFGTVKIAWLFDPVAISWISFIPALGITDFALDAGAVLWIVSETDQEIAIG